MKKLISIVGPILFALIVVFGIVDSESGKDNKSGSSNTASTISTALKGENEEHILAVKNGSPTLYPNTTYGEAFDNFFANPSWKYFVGTKKGTDEDGDGEPDIVEENVDVVEFTGKCNFRDVEVTARIQFTLDMDSGTFDATYLAFNEVPQTMSMLFELINTAFAESVNSSAQTESAPAQSVETAQQTSTNKSADVGKSDKKGQADKASQQRANSSEETYSYEYYSPADLFDVAINNTLRAKQMFLDQHIGVQGYLEKVDTGQVTLVANAAIAIASSSPDIFGNYWWESDYAYCQIYCKAKNSSQLSEVVNMDKGDPILVEGKVTDIDAYGSNMVNIRMTIENISSVGYSYSDMPEEDESWMWEDEYFLPTDTEYISREDLVPYSKEEVSLIRNEIYARYGYNFQNASIREYFESQSWYYPVEGVNASTLGPSDMNEYERANLETITSYEKEMGWR